MAGRNEICCHHAQPFPPATKMLVACSGCARRLRKEHEGLQPVSLWQVMAEDENLKLPDYGGIAMSVHDACPTHSDPQVTSAVRLLLKRMNIRIIEAKLNRANAVCCGDSYYPALSEAAILQKMQERAAQMPAAEVAVYCVSCIKSMYNGGKKPRYLLDLVFGEATEAGELSPAAWHRELEAYIDAH